MRRGSKSLVLYLAIAPAILWTTASGRAAVKRTEAVTLQGKVVDAAGQPVEGVRIRLYREAYADILDSSSLVPAREAVAQADGSFSFGVPVGPYTLLLATSKDRLAEWVAAPVSLRLAPGQVADARIEVRKGGLLEVAVLEAMDAKPIEKARVAIQEQADIRPIDLATDANGVAQVRLLPGRYEIRDVLCEGYSYEGQRQVVTIEEGATERAALILTPNVQGVVRDPNGAPVAGARITIIGAGREEATSDEQGRFEIAWDRRCQFREATAFCLVARHEQRSLAATVEIGMDTSLLDVVVQPCAVLTGRIVDPNAAGIGGAWVYVTRHVPDWGDTPLCEEQTKTDGTGGFEIRAVAPGGQYTLHASADAYGCEDTIISTNAVAGGPLDVGMLTLPPARLSVSGRVLDTRGNPVSGAMIYGWGEGQPIKLDTQTDAAGRFTLQGVCAGPVNLRVDANLGGGRHLRTHVLAGAGATGLQITPRDLVCR